MLKLRAIFVLALLTLALRHFDAAEGTRIDGFGRFLGIGTGPVLRQVNTAEIGSRQAPVDPAEGSVELFKETISKISVAQYSGNSGSAVPIANAAITESGRVFLWGHGNFGVSSFTIGVTSCGLWGDATPTYLSTPTAPIFGNWSTIQVKDLAFGAGAIAVITAEQRVMTAGCDGNIGLLGLGTSDSYSRYLQAVHVPSDMNGRYFIKIVSGGGWAGSFFIALNVNGKLMWWGDGSMSGKYEALPFYSPVTAGIPDNFVFDIAVGQNQGTSGAFLLMSAPNGSLYYTGPRGQMAGGVDLSVAEPIIATIVPNAANLTVSRVFATSHVASFITEDMRYYYYGDAATGMPDGFGLWPISGDTPIELTVDTAYSHLAPWKINSVSIKLTTSWEFRFFAIATDRYGSTHLLAAGNNNFGELLTSNITFAQLELTPVVASEFSSKKIKEIKCADSTTLFLFNDGSLFVVTDAVTDAAYQSQYLSSEEELKQPHTSDQRAASGQGVLRYSTVKSMFSHTGDQGSAAAMITAPENQLRPNNWTPNTLYVWGRDTGIALRADIVKSLPLALTPAMEWIHVAMSLDMLYAVSPVGEIWYIALNDVAASKELKKMDAALWNGSSPPPFAFVAITAFADRAITADGEIWYITSPYSMNYTKIVSSTWMGSSRSQIVQVSGSYDFNLEFSESYYFRLADGRLFGFNNVMSSFDASNPAFSTPTEITLPNPSGVAHVFAGPGMVHIIMRDGSVWGKGQNDMGQLGIGSTNSPVNSWTSLDLSALPSGASVVKVVSTVLPNVGLNGAFAALLTNTSEVYTWGLPFYETGLGNSTRPSGPIYRTSALKTRLIEDIHATTYSLLLLSSIRLIPDSVEIGYSSAALVSVTGFGFGDDSNARIEVLLWLPSASSNYIQCNVVSLTAADRLLATPNAADIRTVTCKADFMSFFQQSTPSYSEIWAAIGVNYEWSEFVRIGNLTPVPQIFQSTQEVPENAQQLIIRGNNFGISGVISVSFRPQGICQSILSRSDNSITCSVVGLPSSGALSASVTRSGAISANADVAIVVEPPSVIASTQQLPYTISDLTIKGTGFGESSSEIVVLLQPGAVACSITFVNSTTIVCSPPQGSLSLGPISASISRNGGSSVTLPQIAKLIDVPKVVYDGKVVKKFAASTPIISIPGLNFVDTSVTVTLSVETAKRATTTVSCVPISVAADTNSVFGLEILTCAPSTSPLPAGTVSASISRLGSTPLAPALIGSIVPSPSISSTPKPTRARTITSFIIRGSNFAASPSHLDNVVSLSVGSCSVVSATSNSIECAISGSPLVGVSLAANVSLYGGVTDTVVVADLVDAPVITISTASIASTASEITISGTNFEGPSSGVQLFLNTDSANCTVSAASTSTAILCAPAASFFTQTGTLFAIVTSNGASSEKQQIGVVAVADPNAITGLPGSSVAGIAIGIVIFAIILALILVFIIRRRLKIIQDIKLQQAIEVSEENKGLFNMKSSDLQILSKLGEGSFGAVYLGRYRGRAVAIKRLAANMLAAQVSDFFREASLMLSLKPHRNIVRIFGMCQEQSNFSLVMELLTGGNLDALVKNTFEDTNSILDDATLFKIVRGVALGMSALCAQGIVHRDLACRNILLDDRLEPRVSDFGFSRVVGEAGSGKTQSAVGPIRWMSPENIANQEYSEKSDVWSFGCLIYEVLTGDSPFAGEDLLQVAVKVRDSGANPLDNLPPQVKYPEYLGTLMHMIFKFSPADRPTFKQCVEFLDKHAPAGVEIPPGDGWIVEDAIGAVKGKKKPDGIKEKASKANLTAEDHKVAQPSKSVEATNTTTNRTNKTNKTNKGKQKETGDVKVEIEPSHTHYAAAMDLSADAPPVPAPSESHYVALSDITPPLPPVKEVGSSDSSSESSSSDSSGSDSEESS